MENDPKDDSSLSALIDAVADGRDVDWDEADTTARNSPERLLIRNLRILGRLKQFFGNPDNSRPHAIEEVPGVPAVAFRPDPSTSPENRVRTSWGSFELRQNVGSGSSGTVYRAWEPRLEREVALKLLHSAESSDNGAGLIHEARLLARIRHPNVVTIFGADFIDGCVGLWMELVKGRTLKEIVNQIGPFSAQEASLIGLGLCGALAEIHKAKLLHRDVKAQNVMRAEGGRIVLMDFGAAGAKHMQRVLGFGLKGTPLYLAPEVIGGETPSEQSDLYSLGVLMYYLVSGSFPVSGETLADIFEAHEQGARTLLRDAVPDLPPAFVHAVDMATAGRPQDRPRSAGAMEALLATALGRTTIRETPGGLRAGVALSNRSRSIAVLSFVDLSPDKSLDFFCDGITEEITNALTARSGVRVVACSSASHSDRSAGDLQGIAARFDVGLVLEGSVRTSGTRLRVISRLVDADDGTQKWSERFDCNLEDVFDVQDQIANAAVRALGIEHVASTTTTLVTPTTRNVDAYTFYLKGRHHWNQRTETGLLNSVALLQQAIDKDPDYAEGYAALAEAYTTLGLYGVLSPDETMRPAKIAALRAIEVFDKLPSPFATLGCIAAVYDWHWTEAAGWFQRAIELNPAHSAAHHWYAINYLVPLGRFAEATTHLQRAIDTDPLSMPVRISLGLRSYFGRHYTDAERELRDSLHVEVGSIPGRLFLGLTLAEMGAFQDALDELQTASQLSRSSEIVAALGYVSARAGDASRARELVRELHAISGHRYVSPSLMAQVHAGLGETGLALDWLDKAATTHAADLAWLRVRPVFDSLRTDGRFSALIARLGL